MTIDAASGIISWTPTGLSERVERFPKSSEIEAISLRELAGELQALA